jgi:hypothetical protein
VLFNHHRFRAHEINEAPERLFGVLGRHAEHGIAPVRVHHHFWPFWLIAQVQALQVAMLG